jgi:hypothetical protein
MSDDDNSYGCAPSSESDVSACKDEQDTEEGQSDEVSCEDIDDIMDVMFGLKRNLIRRYSHLLKQVQCP